jgi:excisionase family DNA binding protein
MNDAATQLDMRENTASSRRHASRSAMSAAPETVDEAKSVENEAAATESRMRNLKMFDLSLTEATLATGEERRTEDKLLTVDEVAARLSVSRNWIYKHADAIGGYRLGKYLRFSWPRVLERLGR